MQATRIQEPRTRPWAREEYEHAAQLGLFKPDEKLELLDGEIVQTVIPQSYAHSWAVQTVADALRAAFGPGFHFPEEKPLALGELSEPEPDVAVVRGRRGAVWGHPTPDRIALLVEVADTSLEYDRVRKAAAYGRQGIPEYWILNLVDRVLEVHRDPDPEAEAGYRTVLTLPPGSEISPLEAPGASLSVVGLLPPIPR